MKQIVAAITTDPEIIRELPGIIAKDENEMQEMAFELGKILRADVHRLVNGLMVLVASADK